ncbi:MAG: hypothetical protein JW993_15625 [Sedimentisphaerales bacterium]|nr:hypothetical protein [Sedimentisphaerales bacterium]
MHAKKDIPTGVIILLAGYGLVPAGLPEVDPTYLSPTSLVASADGKRLYVAEATAGRVAVVDVACGKVIREVAVACHPSGLALSSDGRWLYVTSAVPEGVVQVIDLDNEAVTDTIHVGHTPVALALAPDGQTLYVCNRFDNNVGIIDLRLGRQSGTVAVPREPVAATITRNGRFLFVANLLPASAANTRHVAASVSVIDTGAARLVKNIELPDGSTNLRGIALSPDGKHAYVTHILSRYHFPTAYIERGWVNTNAMTVIDVPSQRYVNTVLLDDIDRGAANPYGVACTADGKHLVVAHAGTHEVSVIDRAALHARLLSARSARCFASSSTSRSARRFLDAGYCAQDIPNDLTFLAGLRRRVKLQGKGPRGVAVVGPKGYVAEYFSDSVAVVDLGANAREQTTSIPLGPARTMTEIRRGEMAFNDASHALGGWHSCASCHLDDGRANALNWDLLNDGVLNPKNAKSLLLAHATPPAMVTGVRANAEIAVRSGIRYVQFAVAPRETAEAMDAYLKSLKPVASPCLVEGKMSEAAREGEVLFRKAGCTRCHAGPLYTDLARHDVGTGTDDETNTSYDTPTLVEAWRTAPYLHDGRAATIEQVLTTFNPADKHGRTSILGEEEISHLAAYVLTR